MKDKIVGNIFETYNYSKFRRLDANRQVTSTRAKAIQNSIAEKDLQIPIAVNEKYEIWDGQGRYESRKNLGLPIIYYVVEGADIKDCRKVNSVNQPWTIQDYLYSFVSEGKEDYVRLDNLMEELGMTNINRILRLANRGSKTNNPEEKSKANLFKSGRLVFGKEECERVRNVVAKGKEIREALDFTGGLNDAFWVAVKVCTEFDGYSHVRMLNRCKKYRASYSQMSRTSDQIVEFERIYNKEGGKKLFFSDYNKGRGYNVRDYTFHKDDGDVSTLKVKK